MSSPTEPDRIDIFFAIIFAAIGLFSGWFYGRWDGLGQAFLGALGAMQIGMLIGRRLTTREKGTR